MDEPKGLIHFSKTPVSVDANHSNRKQIMLFTILSCISLAGSIFYFELIFVALITLPCSLFALLRYNGISSIPLAVNLNHPFMEAGAVDNSEIMVRFTNEWIDPGVHRLKIVKDPISGLLVHKQDGEHSVLSAWDTKKNVKTLSKQLAIIDIALASKERETPEYIQMDEKNKKVKFVRTPKFEEVPYPIVMEPNLVIEYYSR